VVLPAPLRPEDTMPSQAVWAARPSWTYTRREGGWARGVMVPGATDGFPCTRLTPAEVRAYMVPPDAGELAADSPRACLFPTGIRLTTYMRHRVWHCAAELPFPKDVARVVCGARGAGDAGGAGAMVDAGDSGGAGAMVDAGDAGAGSKD
jgi:hypothetical protein